MLTSAQLEQRKKANRILINRTADKMGCFIEEVFEVAISNIDPHASFEIAHAIRRYDRSGYISEVVEDFCLRVLTNKYFLLEKGRSSGLQKANG